MNGGSNMTIKGDYLPDDIIVEILSKLPSKYVLRFKIACKTWYSLISDPVFVNLHTKRVSQLSPKILYRTPRSESSFQLFDYESSSFNNCRLSGPIIFPEESCINPEIVGSSCGLVVVNDAWRRNIFTIWNPLTRECRKIPKLSISNVYERPDYFRGLGYDSVANDFKLVISTDTIRYNIFSLKANSWKTIKCPLVASENKKRADTIISSWNSPAIVLNGVFHWIVIPTAPSNNDLEIVAFDIRKETFHQKLQLPQRARILAKLLEHRGCLCVSFIKNGLDPDVTQIWMMKEYATWIHYLTVKSEYLRLPVLCIFKRSEVIFHTDEKFSKCGKEEVDKLHDDFRSNPFLYGPVSYVETLITPSAPRIRCK